MSQRLPQSVQQIADVIGRDEALRLVATLPRAKSKGHPTGQPILYVPKALPVDHPLVRMLGYPAAAKLSKAFGGEILYPAACVDLSRQRRNGEIMAAIASGEDEATIATRHGITTRQVRNIKRENAPEDRVPEGLQHARCDQTVAAAA